MKTTLLLLTSTAALALPLVGLAAEPMPNSVPGNAPAAAEFDQLDADRDGKISRKEFTRFTPEKGQDRKWWRKSDRAAGEATETNAHTPEMFTALDQNKDGLLSRDELANGQRLQDLRGRINRDGPTGSPSLNNESKIPPPAKDSTPAPAPRPPPQ
jgi:hypothetical protein